METNRGNSDEPQPGDIIPAAVAGGRLPAHAAAQQDLADGEGSATAQRRTEASRQSRRLIAAANELLALAAELEDVARRGNTGRREDGADREAPALLEDDVRWLRHARRTYRNRRSRNALFADEALFGEPAWDLLLDLFIAAKERKRVPVTSACIGAAVPTTTALRWLAVLEERGLVLRVADHLGIGAGGQPDEHPAGIARVCFAQDEAAFFEHSEPAQRRGSRDGGAYAKMVSYFVRATMGDADDTIESARAQGRAVERAWG